MVLTSWAVNWNAPSPIKSIFRRFPGLLRGKRCTLTCACGIANASPQDLTDSHDAFREVCLEDAIVAGARFGKDDVIFLQPLAHSRPEPLVCNGVIIFVLLFGWYHIARDGWASTTLSLGSLWMILRSTPLMSTPGYSEYRTQIVVL